MFDRMVFLSGVLTPEEMQALLTFLNDNPEVVVALRKKKIVMLVNAEKIYVRKIEAIEKFVNSLELKNYLLKQSETDTFTIYKFRNPEIKELHDLAIATYALANIFQEPKKREIVEETQQTPIQKKERKPRKENQQPVQTKKQEKKQKATPKKIKKENKKTTKIKAA